MEGRATRPAHIAAIAVCLALALGGQAMADSLAVGASGGDTADAVGRAASSYLGGIRRYAAAVLWNRVDPVFHSYYSGMPLSEQRYMLGTIAVVQELDPELSDSYYVGSWILIGNGLEDEGMAMAKRGVEANPMSGIVLVNYAQLLQLYGDDRQLMLEMAERAIGSDVQWKDHTEQANAYAALRAVFQAAGRDDLAAFVVSEIEYLEALPEDAGGSMEHDHDHDGVPDH